MTSPFRRLPPTAAEVERRFRSPAVIVTRPMILSSIELLGAARSFHWRPEGLENLARVREPVILAANHQSHADTAAILGTLPRAVRERTSVAAALDVFGRQSNGTMPSIKGELIQLLVAAGFHAFAFDRHGPPLRSVRTAVQLIRNGWNLLLFPEGTRSRTGQMAPFKPGVSVLARITRRPVIPVHVEGGRQILPCGRFLPRPGRVVVRYGPPVWFADGERLESFITRVQNLVRAVGDEDPDEVARLAGLPRPRSDGVVATISAHRGDVRIRRFASP